MTYTIKNFNEKYNHIEVKGFDDTNDTDLQLLINVIEELIPSNCIYFQWCRLNFFADSNEQQKNANLAFECFKNGISLQRILSDSHKFKSKLYVGYQNIPQKSKEAMFYAWRAFEDTCFFSANNSEFKDILCKYKNKTIVYGGEELIDIVQVDVATLKNDTGDTLLIYAKDLAAIEDQLVRLELKRA